MELGKEAHKCGYMMVSIFERKKYLLEHSLNNLWFCVHDTIL